MKNKLIGILMLSAVSLQLAACGSGATASAEGVDFETVTETEVQAEATEGPSAEAEAAVTETPVETEVAADAAQDNAGQAQDISFVGQYYVGKGNLSIMQQESGDFLVEVWWGDNAATHSQWVMHGKYDESAKVITYSDCEKHEITLKDDGEVEADETAYTNGTGSIKIVDENTILWTDDQEHIAADVPLTR